MNKEEFEKKQKELKEKVANGSAENAYKNLKEGKIKIHEWTNKHCRVNKERNR